jgi:hypothetical protein
MSMEGQSGIGEEQHLTDGSQALKDIIIFS